MNKKFWYEVGEFNHYYIDEFNGLVLGEVEIDYTPHEDNSPETSLWSVRIVKENSVDYNKYYGLTNAKKAVELYFSRRT